MTTTEPIRVLLVDDTPDIRMLLRVALEVDGFEVVDEAGDGRAGVEAARVTRPDVVLLDLAMPVMDGLEALPLMRAASPKTKVIVLSGFQARSMEASALAAGADAYLQKGVTPDEIIARVRSVTGAPTPPPPPPPPADAEPPTETTYEELQRLRSAIASTAHEIRNPVATLIGIAQTLSTKGDRIPPEAQARLLAAVGRQARVLDRVTGDLLTASQAERGALRVVVQEVALRPAVADAVASLECDVDIEVPEVEVRADAVRLGQMLSNLLSNAVKYGQPPFRVRATVEPDQVRVQVEDAGDGVPESFRRELFRQYARAEGTRVAGSGIGLYIVRALAEAQEGAAFYAPLEQGSAFGFTLPLARP